MVSAIEKNTKTILGMIVEKNTMGKSKWKILAYIFGCRCCARCMATGSCWFSIRLSDMLVAAAGSSWLLKPFSAYVRLTFCLRFSYVKNGPYETLPKPLLGQWQCETHKEAHKEPHWKLHSCFTQDLRNWF